MHEILDHAHNKPQLQSLPEQLLSLMPVPTSQHDVAPMSVPCDLQQVKCCFFHSNVSSLFFGQYYVQEQ